MGNDKITTLGLIRGFRADHPEEADRTFFMLNEEGVNGEASDLAMIVREKMMGEYKHISDYESTCKALANAMFVRARYFQTALVLEQGKFRIVSGFDKDGLLPTAKLDIELLEGHQGGKIAEMLRAKAMEKFGNRADDFRLAYVFDHETGHILTERMLLENKEAIEKSYKIASGVPGKELISTLGETAADTYSLIRHVQRFGHHTGYLEYIRDCRASSMMLGGDVVHYTSRGINKLIELRDQGKLDALTTPEAAVAMAVDIACKNLVEQKQGRSLSEAFDAMRVAKMPLKSAYMTVKLVDIVSRIYKNGLVDQAAQIYLEAADTALPATSRFLKGVIAKAHDKIEKRMAAAPVKTAQHKAPSP